MHEHVHHHGAECNSHPIVCGHCPPYHQSNPQRQCCREHNRIDQSPPPPRPPKIPLNDSASNHDRHCCAHYLGRTGSSFRDLYDSSYDATSPTANLVTNRKPTDTYHRVETPICTTHQDQPPPYTYAHCISNSYHSASEGDVPSSSRHRSHRGEAHPDATTSSDETKHRQPNYHHSHDQPHSHCHRSHTTTMRVSEHTPTHVSSHNSNPSCSCHREPVRPPPKECSCQTQPKHTAHSSKTLEKEGPGACHFHVRQPSMGKGHRARWAWGPPLPAIVLGHPVCGPGFARH